MDANTNSVLSILEERYCEESNSYIVNISCAGVVQEATVKSCLDRASEEHIRWYFEDYATNRGSPFDSVRATQAIEDLHKCSKDLFDSLNIQQMVPPGSGFLQVEVEEGTESSSFHTIHWELLEDPQLWSECCPTLKVEVIRRVSGVGKGPPTQLSCSCFNVLLITSRDISLPSTSYNINIKEAQTQSGGGPLPDIAYRLISRPIVELISELSPDGCRINIEISRPGTWVAARECLSSKKGFYHLVHFDVHGWIRESNGCQRSYLQFLKASGKGLVLKEASEVAKVVVNAGIPVVILNACESAKADTGSYGNLARVFVREGAPMVAAMAYKVMTDTATIFMRSFYRSILQGKSGFASAVRKGRENLRDQPERIARFGIKLSLGDWIVPVAYMANEVKFDFVEDASAVERAMIPGVPPSINIRFGAYLIIQAESGARDLANFPPAPENPAKELAVTGRDAEILQLETIFLLNTSSPSGGAFKRRILLVYGPAGAGKSALVQHLGWWWKKTCLVERVAYINFDRHDPWTMHSIALELYFCLFGVEPGLDVDITEAVIQCFLEERHLLIWDSLDIISSPTRSDQTQYTAGDLLELRGFLNRLRQGHTFVILISRKLEEWLGPVLDYAWPFYLNGLSYSSAVEYAYSVLRHRGWKESVLSGEDENYLGLVLDYVEYLPLAIEILLPLLLEPDLTPKALFQRLRNGSVPLRFSDASSPDGGRLGQVLRAAWEVIAPRERHPPSEGHKILLSFGPFHHRMPQDLTDYLLVLIGGGTFKVNLEELENTHLRWFTARARDELKSDSGHRGVLIKQFRFQDEPVQLLLHNSLLQTETIQDRSNKIESFWHIHPLLTLFIRHMLATTPEYSGLCMKIKNAFSEYYICRDSDLAAKFPVFPILDLPLAVKLELMNIVGAYEIKFSSIPSETKCNGVVPARSTGSRLLPKSQLFLVADVLERATTRWQEIQQSSGAVALARGCPGSLLTALQIIEKLGDLYVGSGDWTNLRRVNSIGLDFITSSKRAFGEDWPDLDSKIETVRYEHKFLLILGLHLIWEGDEETALSQVHNNLLQLRQLEEKGEWNPDYLALRFFNKLCLVGAGAMRQLRFPQTSGLTVERAVQSTRSTFEASLQVVREMFPEFLEAHGVEVEEFKRVLEARHCAWSKLEHADVQGFLEDMRKAQEEAAAAGLKGLSRIIGEELDSKTENDYLTQFAKLTATFGYTSPTSVDRWLLAIEHLDEVVAGNGLRPTSVCVARRIIESVYKFAPGFSSMESMGNTVRAALVDGLEDAMQPSFITMFGNDIGKNALRVEYSYGNYEGCLLLLEQEQRLRGSVPMTSLKEWEYRNLYASCHHHIGNWEKASEAATKAYHLAMELPRDQVNSRWKSLYLLAEIKRQCGIGRFDDIEAYIAAGMLAYSQKNGRLPRTKAVLLAGILTRRSEGSGQDSQDLHRFLRMESGAAAFQFTFTELLRGPMAGDTKQYSETEWQLAGVRFDSHMEGIATPELQKTMTSIEKILFEAFLEAGGLHIAAQLSLISVAEIMLENGVAIDSVDSENRTPLHRAAQRGCHEILKYLVDKGAAVGAKDKTGKTPLHFADTRKVAEILILGNADVEARDDGGWTPLSMAALIRNLDVMGLLLDHGASTDAEAGCLITPLSVAVTGGHCATVQMLLERGALADAIGPSGFVALDLAVESGRHAMVETLIAGRASVNPETHRWSPLLSGIEKGCRSIVKTLLAHGAEVNTLTSDGCATPLSLAVQQGHRDIVELLLTYKADCNATVKDGYTPLHLACEDGHEENVIALVESGAAVNMTTNSGWTPLHKAAQSGHQGILEVLLEKNAEATVNSMTNDHGTPLLIATQNGHQVAVDMLLHKGADVMIVDSDGWMPLHWAAQSGHQGIMEALLEKDAEATINSTTNDHTTPLSIAAEKGHQVAVDMLLHKRADITIADNNGWMPLHWAAQSGHQGVVEALLEKDAEATINSTTNDLETPLLLAVQDNHRVVVDILLHSGADATMAGIDGWIPLHWAASRGYQGIVEILLGRNAEATVNTATRNHATPLSIAVQRGHQVVVDMLLSNGADITIAKIDGWAPLHYAADEGHRGIVEALLGKNAKTTINSTTNRRDTALLRAIRNGRQAVVDTLLHNGADVTMADINGWAPLHYAADRGHQGIAEVLVARGAAIDAVTTEGNTPLHFAVRSKHVKTIGLLLVAGADPNAWNGFGAPLHKAAYEGLESVIRLLLDHGADPLLPNCYGFTFVSYLSVSLRRQFRPFPNTSSEDRRYYLCSTIHRVVAKLSNDIGKRGPFSRLGKCLVFLGDAESVVALEQIITRQADCYSHKGITCSGCEANISGHRFVCSTCPDTDFCEKCLAERSLATETCNHNDFVKVPRDIWDQLPEGIVDAAGTTLQEWLDRIARKWPVPDHNKVEPVQAQQPAATAGALFNRELEQRDRERERAIKYSEHERSYAGIRTEPDAEKPLELQEARDLDLC